MRNFLTNFIFGVKPVNVLPFEVLEKIILTKLFKNLFGHFYQNKIIKFYFIRWFSEARVNKGISKNVVNGYA